MVQSVCLSPHTEKNINSTLAFGEAEQLVVRCTKTVESAFKSQKDIFGATKKADSTVKVHDIYVL